MHAENALFYFLALKQQHAAPSEVRIYPRGGHNYTSLYILHPAPYLRNGQVHIYPRGGHGYGRCTVNAQAAGAEVCHWAGTWRAHLTPCSMARTSHHGTPSLAPRFEGRFCAWPVSTPLRCGGP